MTEHADQLVDRTGAARCVFAVRRMMKEAITPELVLNPAIDMLLMLYVERDSGVRTSPANVCVGTGVSDTICRHWAGALRQRDFIDVDDDGYALTAKGREAMDQLAEKVWHLAALHLGTASAAESDASPLATTG